MKKLTLKKQKEIIYSAVSKAANGSESRNDTAHKAVWIADEKGVNVQAAPYLQDIFYEALDEYC